MLVFRCFVFEVLMFLFVVPSCVVVVVCLFGFGFSCFVICLLVFGV